MSFTEPAWFLIEKLQWEVNIASWAQIVRAHGQTLSKYNVDMHGLNVFFIEEVC